MRTGERRDFDERCVARVEQVLQSGREQIVADRIEPLRALWVAAAHVVQAAIGMAVERGDHGR